MERYVPGKEYRYIVHWWECAVKIGDYMTEFDYKAQKWKRKRAAILRRDNYLCVECRKYGRRIEASTVHHIKHADTNPELAYENSNLVSLCSACHNKMHPEKGGKRW